MVNFVSEMLSFNNLSTIFQIPLNINVNDINFMNLQEFEEPGADTNKFDMLNPTVVRPPAVQKTASELGEAVVRNFV